MNEFLVGKIIALPVKRSGQEPYYIAEFDQGFRFRVYSKNKVPYNLGDAVTVIRMEII